MLTPAELEVIEKNDEKWGETGSAAVKQMIDTIRQLWAAIEAAPHGEFCDGYDWDHRELTGRPCDCVWKSRVGK